MTGAPTNPCAVQAPRKRRGTTLVEVVVAVALIQVSVAAILGTLVSAQRALVRAESLERTAALAVGLADSLWSAGSVSAGSTVRGDIEARWAATPGVVRLEVWSPLGDTILLQTPHPDGSNDEGPDGA